MRFAAVLLLALAACNPVDSFAPSYRDTSVPISSKALFSAERYAGKWYEIARFPVPFQKGCAGTTATYTPQSGGYQVINTCRVDGVEKRIKGSAELAGPGRLTVSFETVPFVKAPYWVLWVDEDYQTAVVGVPSGRAGWILNRSPKLRADRLKAAKEVLAFNGYDVSQLIMTPQ